MSYFVAVPYLSSLIFGLNIKTGTEDTLLGLARDPDVFLRYDAIARDVGERQCATGAVIIIAVRVSLRCLFLVLQANDCIARSCMLARFILHGLPSVV